LFPFITKTTTESWKALASSVYRVLSKLNPPILSTIVSENETISDEDERKCYTIKWYKLHLPQESTEGFFYCNKPNAYDALKTIGMNLIDTPFDICHEFKQVGIHLPVLSKKSALEYYVRFHDEIFNHKTLPCHVSESKFSNVNNFVSFVIYVYKCINKKGREVNTSDDIQSDEDPAVSGGNAAADHDTNVGIVDTSTTVADSSVVEDDDSIEFEDDDPIEFEDDGEANPILKAGLIITVNENIHSLSDGKKIINSANWRLFPQSCNVFLHGKLMHAKLIKAYKGGGYIFQPSEDADGINVIHSVFSANLPPLWCRETEAPLEDVDISWIKELLECISEDPVFVPYCQQLLRCYTLIPAENGTMYSTKSEILPMQANSLSYNAKLEDLLRKLHVPFVDSSVLGSVLTKINFKLPDIGNPQDVLKSVYLAMKHKGVVLKLNTEELTEMFEIFGSVNYRDYDTITCIKSLPIFHTIRGNMIALSSFRSIWIWNDDVCKVGIEEWMNNITFVAFLHPNAPWKTINMHARKQLGIKEISL